MGLYTYIYGKFAAESTMDSRRRPLERPQKVELNCAKAVLVKCRKAEL